MKNILLVGITALVLVVAAIGTTSIVSADSTVPQSPAIIGVSDQGNPQGRGPRGGMGGAGMPGDGLLHDEIIAAFSVSVGVTVEEIETRLTAGETLSDIAVSKGFTVAEFQTMLKDAHDKAIAAAVVSGDLTREQADWMLSRGNRMNGSQAGRGTGNGFGTGRGNAGQNRMTYPDCPFATQSNP
jgi:carbonic anhydrase/acetyltransferase-like protein (isoleucine patch superfamily)